MVINSKKGQNITKPYALILVMVVVSILTVSMMTLGRDVASDPNNKLNNESINYIYTNSGYVPSINKSEATDADDLFYSSDLNTSGNLKDYALEFQFYREQSSGVRSYVQDFWNFPAMFINGLGLELEAWSVVTQTLNTMIWLIILYLVYRIVRALI